MEYPKQSKHMWNFIKIGHHKTYTNTIFYICILRLLTCATLHKFYIFKKNKLVLHKNTIVNTFFLLIMFF